MKVRLPELLALPGHASAIGNPKPVLDWLAAGAKYFGARPAVEGIDRPGLDHAGLSVHVRRIAGALGQAGLGRGDPVIVMLPNGPEALTAILSLAAVAVALPVGVEEPLEALERLLAQIPVRAVLFDRRHGQVARELCERHGLLPIAILVDPERPAGLFELPELGRAKTPGEPTRLDDAAVLAKTAGTTAEPRLIAWSQASLFRSADIAADWMDLNENDRSLCMMPFAHLHSLVRSCMPGLLRGGAVICAPGFDKVHVLDWIERHRPSYMTAVPGIYRAMLARTEETGWALKGTSLHFLASGSDKIDTATVMALDAAFAVPVREFYGMSEVSPMLAGSPTGMSAQRGGAVGRVMPEWQLECRGETGRALPVGEEGEIVATGGLFNPVVGQGSGGTGRVIDGWYLTGDRGYLDEKGLLHITGRIDERITRGGKKISPEAVEQLLMNHPKVRRALVFPIPDAVLGERLGALAIPVAEEVPTELELRAYLADQLPDYMVPERLVFADDVPQTAAGKVSRKSLAEQLGVESVAVEAKTVALKPRAFCHDEAVILELVQDLLGRQDIDLAEDFMAMGGDSFLATSLMIAVEERFGVLPTPAQFLQNSSVERLAGLVGQLRSDSERPLIVNVQKGDGRLPLFFTHAVMGYAYYAHAFARALGPDQAIYAYQFDDRIDQEWPNMEEYTARYVASIREIQPHGPYLIAGHSFGAHLAFETARQLSQLGEEIAFLALIDDEADLFKRKFGVMRRPVKNGGVYEGLRHMLDSYVPQIYAGDVELFVAGVSPVEGLADPYLGWGDLTVGRVTRSDVPGDHTTVMSDDVIARWAETFRERMELAIESGPEIDSAERRKRYLAYADRADVAAAAAGRLAGRRGELEAEIAHYRRAVALQPEQPYWVYRNLADALRQSGASTDVQAFYEMAIEREALALVGRIQLAEFLAELGNPKQAREQMNVAEALAGNSSPAYERLASGWSQVGDLRAAEACARKAMVLQPENNQARDTLVIVLARQGRLDELAGLVAEMLGYRPDYAYKIRLNAQRLIDTNLLEGARIILAELLEQAPNDSVTGLTLVRLLIEMERPQAALEVSRELTKVPGVKAEEQLQLANLLAELDDQEGVLACLRRAVALEPGKTWVHTRLSRLLQERGQLDEAIVEARRAADSAPNDGRLYQRLGTLFWKVGDMRAAEEALRRALVLGRRQVGVHRILSEILVRTDRPDEALEQARLAVILEPERQDLRRHVDLLETQAVRPA